MTLMTCSSILTCALTTQPSDCQCSLCAHPMSGCDICRTVCNSILTSQRPWSLRHHISWDKYYQPCRLRPSLVAGVDGWVLRVVLDQRLTFEKHTTDVAKSCNYHAQAIRHIRHPLTPDLVQTLACSPILSSIDYCNTLLHGTLAPTVTIHKLQRVQNIAARIVLQAPRRSDAKPLLRTLHWLPVE